jgi:hypothetical protein
MVKNLVPPHMPVARRYPSAVPPPCWPRRSEKSSNDYFRLRRWRPRRTNHPPSAVDIIGIILNWPVIPTELPTSGAAGTACGCRIGRCNRGREIPPGRARRGRSCNGSLTGMRSAYGANHSVLAAVDRGAGDGPSSR